ncbi:aldehyde dehydrogenase family protein [Mycobacterium sp.]|uniref:aldehyde dehydrogenase family protein n=1 Tax=Mycobacterium sp. TaxID=1785 RepID=UPI0025F61F75|nr:aldehyde dehydrogenase family protein [Mycobacterium sp.]MBW0014101.1 aldehyde dehydrogenase family protein [Mycobacterium sp.]
MAARPHRVKGALTAGEETSDETVGHAPAADRAQLDAAVSAARRAAPGWRALGVAERVAAIAGAATTAAGQLAASHGARLYTREHGKVLSEANFEISAGPGLAALIGSMAEAALAPEQVDPGAMYPRLHREPYGVAALVPPFNWPLARPCGPGMTRSPTGSPVSW